jgi:hypothetical protein
MWKTLTTRYFIPPIGSSPIVWGVIMAIIIALPSLTYPICGQSFFINNKHARRILDEPLYGWVDGPAAVALMFFYLFVGLTFHFAYFWRAKPALEKFSPIFSNISVMAWFTLAIIYAFI